MSNTSVLLQIPHLSIDYSGRGCLPIYISTFQIPMASRKQCQNCISFITAIPSNSSQTHYTTSALHIMHTTQTCHTLGKCKNGSEQSKHSSVIGREGGRISTGQQPLEGLYFVTWLEPASPWSPFPCHSQELTQNRLHCSVTNDSGIQTTSLVEISYLRTQQGVFLGALPALGAEDRVGDARNERHQVPKTQGSCWQQLLHSCQYLKNSAAHISTSWWPDFITEWANSHFFLKQ